MATFKKILKDILKERGLSTISSKIVSVKTEANSARVRTLNLFKSERETLEKILGEFEQGHFDGMQDLYVYSREESKHAVSFKYIFLNNEFAPAIVEQIKTKLREEWDIVDDKTAQEKKACWYDVAVNRELCALESA